MKKNAIPTNFLNLPHYYPKPKLIERAGLAFSEIRWQRQLENLEVANAAFLESDKFYDLMMLSESLQKEQLLQGTLIVPRCESQDSRNAFLKSFCSTSSSFQY